MLPGVKRTVLVSPINWGLGHATRVIPIIRLLKKSGFNVVIGAYGSSSVLLKKECPDCVHVELKGFNPYYSSSFSQSFALMVQSCSFLFWKIREHKRTKKIVKDHNIDFIISDNRYGVRHKNIRSVIITHQLSPKLNGLLKLFEGAAARFFKKWIARFDECWIPDVSDTPGISGVLSENRYGINNVKRIGILSRFNKCVEPAGHKYKYLAVISGPEPWRSLLEKDVLVLFSAFKEKCAIVRGVPEGGGREYDVDGITYFDHLDSEALNNLMCSSENLLCRPGYSTLLDLFKIGRRALLVPTPGQPEQEYLAGHLSTHFGFLYVEQKDITSVDTSTFRLYEKNFNLLSSNLNEKLPVEI